MPRNEQLLLKVLTEYKKMSTFPFFCLDSRQSRTFGDDGKNSRIDSLQTRKKIKVVYKGILKIYLTSFAFDICHLCYLDCVLWIFVHMKIFRVTLMKV